MGKIIIEDIHESLVNGQRKQMKDQIDEYGDEFWTDYKGYLQSLYQYEVCFNYYTDSVISYSRIKNR